MSRKKMYLVPLVPGAPRVPEFINGCQYWRTWMIAETGETFKRPCKQCGGCKMARHNRIVGMATAEAEASACTLSLTLTYADIPDENGNMVAPDAAKHLNYEDVSLFLTRLRSAGFKFRKIAAGEYGKETGRAHWHLLVFFTWDAENSRAWFQDFVEETTTHSSAMKSGWVNCVPKIDYGHHSYGDFMGILNDEDVLYCTPNHSKVTARYPQKWSFWPHGLVEGQIVRSPENLSTANTSKAIRYVVKYISKDPWRDVTRYRQTPFEALPKWVKESTDFGPWREDDPDNEAGKWSRGNSYRRSLIKANERKYPKNEDIPLDERVCQNVYNYKAVGGLGSVYFNALGVRFARMMFGPGDAKFVSRTFELGERYRKKQRASVLRAIEQGRLPEGVKSKFSFQMTDANYLRFGEGFKSEYERIFGVETDGPDDVWLEMDAKQKAASDASSGPLGYSLWNKANPARRAELEDIWSKMPDKDLQGMVPRRFITSFEESSYIGEWPLKRRLRRREALEGKEKYKVVFASDCFISITDRSRVFYTALNLDGSEWWRREVTNFELLDHAIHRVLLPPDANIMKLEREGQGDLSPLPDVGPAGLRDLIQTAASLLG